MRAWHGWLLAFILAIVLPTLIQRPDRTDLHILAQAADRLWNGQVVYRLDDVNEHTKPPLATFVFLPFSSIPLFWLSRLWDLFNLAVYIAFIRFLVRQGNWPPGVSQVSVAFGATFLCLTPLNAELRLGQYNVLLLAWLVFTVFKKRAGQAGVALCLAVLFKPTFLFLAPWVLWHSGRPGRVVACGAGSLLALGAGYAALFGISGLVGDLQSWLAFLPQSSAKHLLRWDNHGLPSVVASWTQSNPERAFLAVGLVLSTVAAALRDKMLGLALTGVWMVLFSPMAWLQNFTLLLPGVVWMQSRYVRSQGAERVGVAGALFILWLGIGALNPTTCQWIACETWAIQRIPLWALLASLAIAVTGRYGFVFWRAGAAQ